MTLLELAERCERAEGPDRNLDAVIHKAVTTFDARRAGPGWPDENAPVVPAFPGWRPLPDYTASIDAALTLVPDEHAVDLTWWPGGDRARVLPIYQDGDRWLHRGCDPHYCANAATAELALCAAALRARAAQ